MSVDAVPPELCLLTQQPSLPQNPLACDEEDEGGEEDGGVPEEDFAAFDLFLAAGAGQLASTLSTIPDSLAGSTGFSTYASGSTPSRSPIAALEK